jgi:hypothetical protein
MIRAAKLWIALMLLFGSHEAQAAVDWCRFLPLLPSPDRSFDQIAAGIDQLGCTALPQESAHARSWLCTDREVDDTAVMLNHMVSRYGDEPNLLIIESPALSSLSPFRTCGAREMSGGVRDGEFDPGSIAVRDRLTIMRDYRMLTLHLLRIAGAGSMVSGYPDRLEGTPVVEIAETGLFGIRRESYPSTGVEIAGRNLITSPARDVVAALEARGARITSREPSSQLAQTIVLTAPVGLDGVSSISVHTLGQHVSQVHYEITGLEAYQSFVGLLDERYGRSTAENGRTSDRRECRDRFWFSGKITIGGQYCPTTGYGIWFTNMVVDAQREAHVAYLRRMQADRAGTPSRRRRIDPDNL